MRAALQPLLLLALLLPFLPYAVGVFSDDAYHTDWHIPLLGPSLPSSTFFHRPSSESKASLIYTLSDRSTIAAINPKDGSIIWRHALAQEGTTGGIARGGTGVIFTAVGTNIACFDAASGKLAWDNDLNKNIVDVRITEENNAVVLLEDGVVGVLSDDTGELALERLAFGPKETPHSLWLVGEDIIVISIQPSKRLKFSTLRLRNWDHGIVTISVSDLKEGTTPVNDNNVLSWIQDSGKTLMVIPFGQTKPLVVTIPEKVTETNVISDPTTVVVQYRNTNDSWAVVYNLNDKKVLEKTVELPVKEYKYGSTLSIATSGSTKYIVWTMPNGETYLYGIDKPTPLASYELPKPKAEAPPPDQVPQDEKTQRIFERRLNANTTLSPLLGASVMSGAISEVMPRADGSSYAVRTFVSSTIPGFRGDTHMIRNGKIEWTRPESLSTIVESTWVELLDPATEEIFEELEQETHTNIASAYIHRLRRHLYELQTFGPAWVKALPERIYNAFMNIDSDPSTGKWRDFFGFRKYAIVITKEGGVAAIDVGRGGELVWRTSFSSQGMNFQKASLMTEIRKGTIAVVLSNGWYTEFNAFEGMISLVERIGEAVASVGIADTPSGNIIVSLLDNGGIVMNPHYLELPSPIHLTTQEPNSNALEGIRITPTFEASVTWKFTPPSGESITSYTTRPIHDPVASIGHVLGDRGVLYKYLNRHLLAVSTVNPAKSTASIYVLDSISGAILHSATHTSVDTTIPILTTLSQNFLVYSYFSTSSTSSTGHHLVVSEFFESEFKNDRGELGDRNNVSSLASATKPYVQSQAYVFPSPISSLTTTSTKQGITSIEILAALPRGIYAIPKRILDPRRPIGRDPTPAEREEGLFRYSPVIEVDPKAMITHERELYGEKHISTSPSQLESTSLVFSYGGDLFGTRVAPSQSFDLLGKGFGKVQLVLTVVALFAGAMVVAPMVRRRQIDARWRQ